MLYSFLKIYVSLAATIFCRRIVVNKPALLHSNGPLLLAANHPNSFLDAVLLDILFKKPIWSLARGDVFKKPVHIKLLTKLKILPVYRVREGVENLEANYETFEACKNIFRQNGLVLIFSEGLCVNEWHLRPLKKGTARLAVSTWQDDIDLKVLPVGINYNSFKKFGKTVIVNLGNTLGVNDIDMQAADGKRNMAFNGLLQAELQQLVFEIPVNDKELRKEKFSYLQPNWKKAVLFLPAMIGYILNAPIYLVAKSFVNSRTMDTDHYDSVLLAILLFSYPFYILLLVSLLFIAGFGLLSWLMVALPPFTAWCYVQWRNDYN